MAKITSTGTSFAIAASVPATYDETGYAALTYTDVGEILTIGEYGASTDVVNSQPLATGVTEKFKGFINYGSMTMGLERDSEDAGQAILSEAVTGATKNDAHSVRVTYQDGSIDYLDVRVFSYTKNPGGANQMVGSNVAIEINRAPVEVAAP